MAKSFWQNILGAVGKSHSYKKTHMTIFQDNRYSIY